MIGWLIQQGYLISQSYMVNYSERSWSQLRENPGEGEANFANDCTIVIPPVVCLTTLVFNARQTFYEGVCGTKLVLKLILRITARNVAQ